MAPVNRKRKVVVSDNRGTPCEEFFPCPFFDIVPIEGQGGFLCWLSVQSVSYLLNGLSPHDVRTARA